MGLRRIELWLKTERAVAEAQARRGATQAVGFAVAGICALFAFAAIGISVGAALEPLVGLPAAVGLVALLYLLIAAIAVGASAREMAWDDTDVVMGFARMALWGARQATGAISKVAGTKVPGTTATAAKAAAAATAAAAAAAVATKATTKQAGPRDGAATDAEPTKAEADVTSNEARGEDT
jgi:hypothetical protein